ncbi:hypothetical protein DL768_008642 [Monosporascus sp. mg162]|nr:hypothetical protein DL768_008642 [Monosporascus sp. mg162]
MAPLGIITAIVSAIRVCGPSWLKAIVGRARENLAVAEAELVSSTSQEVCELWNGQQVVRCMGSAPIAEFICLLPATGPKDGAEITAIDLDTAKQKKYLEHIELNIRQDFRRWRASKNTPSDSEEAEQALAGHSASEIIIIRNKSATAPNISLNSHDQFWRGELRAAAVFGTLLQLGYVPTLWRAARKRRDIKHARGEEPEWFWLQQTKTVSDQVFDSFAIFAKDGRTAITTSSRTDKENDPTNLADRLILSVVREVAQLYGVVIHHYDKYKNRNTTFSRTHKQRETTNKHAAILALKTVLGRIISLCGFIVQSIGLRGMHWSASAAQLGTVLVMTCLRAWVRRGLAKPPQCKRLLPGFELEWFAMTLGDPDNAPWLYTSSPDSKTTQDWRIVTGGGPEAYKALAKTSEGKHLWRSDSSSSEAHTMMMMRRHLGKLAGWRGPASTEAISVTRAIEATMDALFGPSLRGDFTWLLEAHYARLDIHGDTQPVQFRLEQHNGAWKAFADEIEAALSLWLYAVREEEQHRYQQMQERLEAGEDDAWLRTQGLVAKQSLRLLGPSTPTLHRDLQWWMLRDAAGITEVEEDDKGMLKVENHRVVGCGSNPSGTCPKPGETRYNSQDMAKVSFGPANKHGGEGGARYAFLATESYSPLKLLYAQDMFSAFVWAAAETMTRPVEGSADIRPDDPSSVNAWQSFTLRNTVLSKMAQDIQGTGLGSLDQIYLSIIPPLIFSWV